MKITALAQLVELYAECRGVTSTKELAELTGYTDRAIRKAKAELQCRNQSSERNQNAGTRVPKAEPQCRPLARAQAILENSNITKHNTTDSASSGNPATDDFVVLNKCLRAADGKLYRNGDDPRLQDVTEIKLLLSEGFDLDKHIIPIIENFGPTTPVNSWKYWASIVRTRCGTSDGKPKPTKGEFVKQLIAEGVPGVQALERANREYA
jgi:hypothetical protein